MVAILSQLQCVNKSPGSCNYNLVSWGWYSPSATACRPWANKLSDRWVNFLEKKTELAHMESARLQKGQNTNKLVIANIVSQIDYLQPFRFWGAYNMTCCVVAIAGATIVVPSFIPFQIIDHWFISVIKDSGRIDTKNVQENGKH